MPRSTRAPKPTGKKSSAKPARKTSPKKTVSSVSASPRPSQKSQVARSPWFYILWILFGSAVVAFLLCRVMGWRLFMDSNRQVQLAPSAELSGTVRFTALQPEPEDKGDLMLHARRVDSNTWQEIEPLALKQDSAWVWHSALPGVNYELQATLVIDGKEIKKSEMVQTTAPAADIRVPLEVNWHDLPEDVVNVSTTSLGGTVFVNGYISPSSVLEVYALDAVHFSDGFHQVNPEMLTRAVRIASVSNPQSEVTWEWNEAKPLEKYMVVVVLRDRGELFGVSKQLRFADAGETSLEHMINSEIVPPTGMQSLIPGISTLRASVVAQGAASRGISGTTSIVGPLRKNSSLLMLQRKPGEENYTPINRYAFPSQYGTKWQFADAEVGQAYEIMAALQVNDQNTSTPPGPTTVVAPASNVNFALNTWYTMPRPTTRPSNEVCLDGDGKSYTAVLVLPKIADATQYWFQVGEKSGQSGTYNHMLPVVDTDGDMKIRVRVDKSKQYFMRYSYATCEHCSGPNNFSPYSDEVGFTCD